MLVETARASCVHPQPAPFLEVLQAQRGLHSLISGQLRLGSHGR